MYKSKFQQWILAYYSSRPIRILINIITFICQITLAFYLMLIPIQLAYHNLLSDSDNKRIQDITDVGAVSLFSIHILLYFNTNLQKILKKPHSLPTYNIGIFGKWTRLITFQLAYDIACWGLAVYMAPPERNSFAQRVIQLFFCFKVYKLYKFHKKTIFLTIGTIFYPIYKVFFTLLIVFIFISYLSSIFYANDYQIYMDNGPYQQFIWLQTMSTQPNLIEKPFIVQLLISNYWALGTASTAAYGDIAATGPNEVIFNIFVLFFAGFLYGFYVSNIHSIPLQAKQQQMKIIQRFDQFQKHNKLSTQSSSQLTDQLYLKIICSLEYKQSERTARKRVEQVVPIKYLEQIKIQIYSGFLNFHQILYYKTGFWKYTQTILQVVNVIKEFVCQKGQNIYDYQQIKDNDLIFINQGQILLTLPQQLKNIVNIRKVKGQVFGQYNFITNSKHPINAIAAKYVSIYSIKRQQYKKCLTLIQAKQFDFKFSQCLLFNEQHIKDDPYTIYNNLLKQKDCILNINDSQCKTTRIQQILKGQKVQRKYYQRQNTKSNKMYDYKNNDKISVFTQTEDHQQIYALNFDQIIQI